MKLEVDAAIANLTRLEQWSAAAIESIKASHWIPKSSAAELNNKYGMPEPPAQFAGALLNTTLAKVLHKHNEKHFLLQRQARMQFFDTVEKNPLTDEQITACVCMDDSVLVVAAAGSGKTSTIVAKTGYVLHEQLAAPNQILLLAFNRATADEVSERIAEQLRNVPGVDQVKSNTFHAFGIEVIAKATGKKPSLAPWIDPNIPGADLREMADIVQTLATRDATFKRDWDMFRTILSRDIGKWGQHQEPDACQRQTGIPDGKRRCGKKHGGAGYRRLAILQRHQLRVRATL
ncbi:MAG: UvrD-helicase domain-containing protein [Hahellaceae bacterium]|nr:UvrD-helicase domain-containing protein [Hahellaceae bacterium]